MIGDCADLGLATGAQRLHPGIHQPQGVRPAARLPVAKPLARGRQRDRHRHLGRAPGADARAHHREATVVLPLCIACVTLPFYSLMQMQDGIARSYNWIHLALLPPYVVRHLIMLVLVSAAYLLKFPTTAETAVVAVGCSFVITVAGKTLRAQSQARTNCRARTRAYEIKAWYSISLPILMVEGCYLLLTSTDVLLLQQFRAPEDVAVYYAAAKTLALITFVHFAVAAAVGHRFSEYHVTDDRERLEAILIQLGPLDILGVACGHHRDAGDGAAAAVAVRLAVRRRLPL